MKFKLLKALLSMSLMARLYLARWSKSINWYLIG